MEKARPVPLLLVAERVEFASVAQRAFELNRENLRGAGSFSVWSGAAKDRTDLAVPGKGSGGPVDAEVADLLVQRLDVDLEHPGGTSLVPAGRLEHPLDVLTLDLVKRQRRQVRRLDDSMAAAELGRQIEHAHVSVAVEDVHPLDEVPELADVSRPRVVDEAVHGVV